jgi:hypothetical protein
MTDTISCRQGRYARTAAWLGLGAALTAYIALSVQHIRCPGLGYDEVMWASTAVGRPDAGWIAWNIGRWPVLLALPYIGALKGYIYAPILTLFPADPLSIRLPMILFGAAGIAMTFSAGRRTLGSTGAFLVALFLAINPEIVQGFRHDLGPAATDFMLRAACLLLLLRYAENERPRDAILFWFLASIGVWQKLTFIWYVNAYVVAFALMQGKSWALRRQPGRFFRALVPHAVAYFSLVAWVGWVYVAFRVAEVQASLGSGSGTPPLVRIETLGRALGLFFQGIESIKVFLDPSYIPTAGVPFLVAFLALVAIGVLRGAREVIRRTGGTVSLRGIFVISALAVTVQLAVTLPADKVWHRLSLEPFATWLAVDGLLAVASVVAAPIVRPIAVRTVYAAVIVLVAIGNVAYVSQIHRYLSAKICGPAIHLRSFHRAIQTTAIWRLLDLISASNRPFVFLDWGMWNQALLMTRSPERVVECASLRAGTVEAQEFAEKYLIPDTRTEFVLHGPEYTCYPETREAFLDIAEAKGIALRLRSVIKEDGAVAFEIWEVSR